ncbi:MAG: AAA family ATPase [Candidatus Paceibacterota bacterium]
MQYHKLKSKDNIQLMHLMKICEHPYNMGINFHLYLRKKFPTSKFFGNFEGAKWRELKEYIEEHFMWDQEHQFIWEHYSKNRFSKNDYLIHLNCGITIVNLSDDSLILYYDAKSDLESKELILAKIDQILKISRQNSAEIGILQNNHRGPTIQFIKMRMFKQNLIPFFNSDSVQFFDDLKTDLNCNEIRGLYLLHGKPGTGKTSFIKEIMKQVNRRVIYISPNMVSSLTSPDLISILMEYPDSILVIEDAETALMERKADNSSAVSNLLNLSDGFLGDFLNICIICTFNTEIENIDSALLRKGRLKGAHEFRELPPENVQQIASILGIEIASDQKLTLAEVCNQSNISLPIQKKAVGFVSE